MTLLAQQPALLRPWLQLAVAMVSIQEGDIMEQVVHLAGFSRRFYSLP
jgi:hypothetical protein